MKDDMINSCTNQEFLPEKRKKKSGLLKILRISIDFESFLGQV